eukprot:TRINITY_DN3512_c0_g1_i10.p2 TRINITY_DN3512_c0_g1~~TRINITY_DN3512_c0_g1_i10.p2  ORF type:complete len:163 (-),score=39.48 TRINITY_DN3512_c0_g1_i10:1074-1562(-)
MLCDGVPEEFRNILGGIRSLKFEEEPNYEALRKPLQDLFCKHNYKYDLIFDWNMRNKIKGKDFLSYKYRPVRRYSDSKDPRAEEKVPRRTSENRMQTLKAPLESNSGNSLLPCGDISPSTGQMANLSLAVEHNKSPVSNEAASRDVKRKSERVAKSGCCIIL